MNKELKIVTVTLNPALDLTGSLKLLQKGTVNLLETSSIHPAGKGINVAKVLADLGAEVTVTGFLGSKNQESFVQLFNDKKIIDQFIRVNSNTRINVKIVEQGGQVSDLNFPGISVKKDEIKLFEKKLSTLAESHKMFVISGSLPLGVSPVQLTDWIETLKKKGCKVFFDSSNGALVAGINAGPYLIKPNDEELNIIVGKILNNNSEIIAAAKKLQGQGCENVVVSLGNKGVLWIDQENCIQAIPQKVDVVSTVGAGDTLVAGLCWSELNQWGKIESLSFSAALAASAVTQIGVGIKDIKEIEVIQKKIKIISQLINT